MSRGNVRRISTRVNDDTERRAAYETWLQSGLVLPCTPYDAFCAGYVARQAKRCGVCGADGDGNLQAARQEREAVLEAVSLHPDGATATDVALNTGLPKGTASWHMREAAKEGTLRCTPNGNRTRYFRVTGTPTPPRPVRNARAQDVSEMQGRILQLIKKERLTPIEIANSLGLSRTDYVFRKAMQAIRESGKVTIVSQGSRRSYHLTGSQSA